MAKPSIDQFREKTDPLVLKAVRDKAAAYERANLRQMGRDVAARLANAVADSVNSALSLVGGARLDPTEKPCLISDGGIPYFVGDYQQAVASKARGGVNDVYKIPGT